MKNRVRITRTVKPETVKLLKQLVADSKADGRIDQGRVIDRAVAALAVAESFGIESLNVNRKGEK